jgi:hypothetical protein
VFWTLLLLAFVIPRGRSITRAASGLFMSLTLRPLSSWSDVYRGILARGGWGTIVIIQALCTVSQAVNDSISPATSRQNIFAPNVMNLHLVCFTLFLIGWVISPSLESPPDGGVIDLNVHIADWTSKTKQAHSSRTKAKPKVHTTGHAFNSRKSLPQHPRKRGNSIPIAS